MSRCVVFDLDDTLYPEADYARGGLTAAGRWAASEHGLAGLEDRLLALFANGRRGDIFDAALAQIGADAALVPALVPRLVEVYRTHTPSLTLFEDAAWALDHFAAQGPLGLITDGWTNVQLAKVAALGLESRIGTIIATDTLGGRAFWKPHPAAFEAMELGHAGANGFVYVADNPSKDFLAPNARGWVTVRIARPGGEYGSVLAPPGGDAHHTIASLRELPAVLSRPTRSAPA